MTKKKGGADKTDRKSGAEPAKRSETKPEAGTKKATPPTGKRVIIGRMWWCILAGVLIFTSFPFRTTPASNIWVFAWFALVPLMFAVQDATAKQAFWLGWLTGTVTNFGGFHWESGMLVDFGGFPEWLALPATFLLNAYQGLAYAFIASFWVRFRPRDKHGREQPMSIFRVAMIFTAVEFAFPMIFPWFYGNSQYRTLAAIQVADLGGVPLVTFVMVAFNAALYRVLRRFTHNERPAIAPLAAGFGLTVAALVYGFIRISQVQADVDAAETLKLGLVEANVGIWSKEVQANPNVPRLQLRHSHLLRHHRLSQELEDQNVDLIIWPESSYQPLDRVYVKRTNKFMLLATADGQLAQWRDMGPAGSTPHKVQPVADASATITGMHWAMVPTPKPLGRLRAAASEREDAAVVVGEAGAAAFFNGYQATPIETSTNVNLNGVAITSARKIPRRTAGVGVTIWAVGDNGTLLRGTPKAMDRISSGTTKHLRGVALFSAATGLTVGDGGTITTITKSQSFEAKSPTKQDLLAVWAAPPLSSTLHAYAVGAKGTIVKLAESAFVLEKSPTTAVLRAVAGDDKGELVVAVGDNGTALIRTKGVWRREQVGDKNTTLVTVEVDAMGRVLAAAQAGGVYERTDKGWTRHGTPGIVNPVALTSLGWIRHDGRLPRDLAYMRPSSAATPPTDGAFFDDPGPEFNLPEWERAALQRGHRTPVLFGGITSEPRDPPDARWPTRDWNTAIMVDHDGRTVGLYDKVYLLVGGEFIPFGDQFPVIYDWIQNAGRFEAGNEVKVFHWRGYRLGVMICYEDILPKFNRRLADLEPHVILNVTNDAWFGKTAEPYLHMALAVFRSIEQRRSLVRATNTGVSAFISPTGELVAQTSLEDPETLVSDVPMMTGKTIYARIGDVFAWALVGWLLFLVLPRMWAWRQDRSRRPKPVKKKKRSKKSDK